MTASYRDTAKGKDLCLLWGFCLGFHLAFFKGRRLKRPRDGEKDPSSSACGHGYLSGGDPGDHCTVCVAYEDAAPTLCFTAKLTEF